MHATEILLNSQNSGKAFMQLYKLAKQGNRQFSLQYLCNRANIPSRGYLSDVLHGRRVLNPKYHSELVNAFNLKAQEKSCLKLLLSRDSEENHKSKEKLERRIASAKKRLQTHRKKFNPQDQEHHSIFEAFELFAAFGLHGRARMTTTQMQKLLNSTSEENVNNRLTALHSWGVLEQHSDGTYSLNKNDMMFSPATDSEKEQKQSSKNALNRFVKQSIQESLAAADCWIGESTDSFFGSTMLSVSQEEYRAMLPQLREFVDNWSGDLANEKGDAVVCMNFQVYPTLQDNEATGRS